MDKRVERVGARVLLLAAAGFCGNISWQLVLPVLPLHLARLGYTTAQIGFLISILSLVMGTVELQAGFVARAVGRRVALVTGFSANAICLVLASAARSAGAVALTLGAIGGARAVFVPPLQAAVAESSTASTRGRVLSVYWFWASAATLVGPAVGGFIAARHGDRAPFYLASAMSLLALPAVAAATAPRRAAPAGTSHELRSVLANRTVVRLSAACMLCFGISGLWSTFLPLQMAHHGISVAVVGWVFAVQGCLYTLMQIATGRMIAHRRAAWVAPAGIVGMSAAAVLVPLLRSPAGFLALGAVLRRVVWGDPGDVCDARDVADGARELHDGDGRVQQRDRLRVVSGTAPRGRAGPGQRRAAVRPRAPPRPGGAHPEPRVHRHGTGRGREGLRRRARRGD